MRREEILELCAGEGWSSWTKGRARALRALTADRVTTLVAVDTGDVAAFAQMFGDGEFQAYLASLVVDPRVRRRGIAGALIFEALRHAGGERLALLSEDAAVGFYESIAHRRKPGFRTIPSCGEHADSRHPRSGCSFVVRGSPERPTAGSARRRPGQESSVRRLLPMA